MSTLSTTGSTRAWRKLRLKILKRDDHTCQIRGPHCTDHATEVDHRIRRTDGGTDDPDNLQGACTPCHEAKSLTEQQRPTPRAGSNRPRPKYRRTPPQHPGLM